MIVRYRQDGKSRRINCDAFAFKRPWGYVRFFRAVVVGQQYQQAVKLQRISFYVGKLGRLRCYRYSGNSQGSRCREGDGEGEGIARYIPAADRSRLGRPCVDRRRQPTRLELVSIRRCQYDFSYVVGRCFKLAPWGQGGRGIIAIFPGQSGYRIACRIPGGQGGKPDGRSACGRRHDAANACGRNHDGFVHVGYRNGKDFFIRQPACVRGPDADAVRGLCLIVQRNGIQLQRISCNNKTPVVGIPCA